MVNKSMIEQRQVLDIAARFMRPGVTGDEIDRVVYQARDPGIQGHRMMVRYG